MPFEPKSTLEWVLRLVLAFPDAERKRDVRTLAAAVEALEKRYDEEGSDG
mgnify:CR=1 FL=1